MQRKSLTVRTSYFRTGFVMAIFTLVAFGMQAQVAFHRLYPAEKNKKIATITSTQIKDGHYVSMHLEVEPDEDNHLIYGDTLILTSYKAKGDMAWSKYIILDAAFDRIHQSLSSIVQGSNDSIYFSFVADKAGTFVQVLGALDMRGNQGFLRTYTHYDDKIAFTGQSHVLANLRNSLFNAYSVEEANQRALHLSRLNYEGDTVWTKSLQLPTANNQASLGALRISGDDLIAVGSYQNGGSRPYVLVVDTLGTPSLSLQFRDTISNISQMTGLDVRRLADSSFVVVGNIIVPTNIPELNKVSGFVIKTDKRGDVEWSRIVAFPGDSLTTLSYCTINRNQDIILGGLTVKGGGGDDYFYIIRLTTEGQVVWQKKYVQPDGSQNFLGGALYEAIDWGIVYMATGVNDKGKVGPAFIKTDTDGSTTCELDITEEIMKQYGFVAETLSWNAKNINNNTYEDIAPKTGAYGFDIPVVGLDIKTFCPKEPIDWTFDASVKNNASTYEWSDGSTEPTLRVFEEGEYSVIVYMNDNVCYMLCDTAKLERYSEPEAKINQILGNFCDNGKLTLNSVYYQGHPDIKSITWSSGEIDVRSIEISQPGVYSITIVDACDEIATASLDVKEFPKPITAASIEDHINVDCAYGNLSGSLEASGNSSGLDELGQETYRWNIGSSAKRIVVENVETLYYSVTVTDACGNTATAFKEYEIKGPSNLKLSIGMDESRKCTEGIVRLNAFLETQSPKIKYQWDFEDKTTPAIEVTQDGVYNVTITDVCGNTMTASQRVEFKGPLNLQANANVDYDELCQNGETNITLSVNPSGNYTYSWSTGATTPDITVQLGTFTVTISDHCDNHYTYPFKVDFNDIIFANIFFPDGTFRPDMQIDTSVLNSGGYKNAELYNRTFGPVDLKIYCLNQVTDYELYVFNRWGQEVFSSKHISDEWDGNYKGAPAPSEAYVWVVKYKLLGTPRSAKGSVTLIRL